MTAAAFPSPLHGEGLGVGLMITGQETDMTAASKPPFSLVGIDHVVFIVDDLDKAVKWYADVLGCQPGYSYPALGMEQVWCGEH